MTLARTFWSVVVIVLVWMHLPDLRGAAVSRVCNGGVPMSVVERRVGPDGRYLVIGSLTEGECAEVHGSGVVTMGFGDSDYPQTRVRLRDGRWGWITIADRPVRLEYSPHLAVVRRPILTLGIVLGLAYLAWYARQATRESRPRT